MAQILSKRREVHLKLAILLVLSLTRCSTDDSEPAAPGMNLAPPPETTVMVDRGHHNSHHPDNPFSISRYTPGRGI